MKQGFLVAALIFLVLPEYAGAVCTSTVSKESLSKIPVLKQEGNICSYHSAAFIFDYYRIEHDHSKDYRKTSPIKIACQANDDAVFDGGVGTREVGSLIRFGGCPAVHLEESKKEELHEKEQKLISDLNNLKQKRSWIAQNFNPGAFPEKSKKLLEKSAQSVCEKYQAVLPDLNLDIKYITQYIFDEYQGKTLKFMQDIALGQCADSERLKITSRVSLVQVPQKDFFKTIDDLKEPMLIAIDAKWLDPDQRDDARHSVVVTDVRYDAKKKKCSVKLQNWWGNSPSQNEQLKVEGSSVWVDSEELSKHFQYGIYLQKSE